MRITLHLFLLLLSAEIRVISSKTSLRSTVSGVYAFERDVLTSTALRTVRERRSSWVSSKNSPLHLEVKLWRDTGFPYTLFNIYGHDELRSLELGR